MRVPLEWLKEFVTIRDTPEALAGRLTMAGLEVVGIERVNGEPVLDLEITPNRADCLSILGVAREVAVLTGQRLKLPGQETGDRRQGKRGRTRLMSHVSCLKIVIEDRAGCRRYIGRLLEGVRMGSSPAWMQRRLAACGLRPINTVVDITNYVLLETGQPLHAFDFDRLAQGTIVVRRAQATEALTTLDGVRRTLSPEILVIADAETPVAVAGVMGGVGSEVTPTTRRVLLESAWFDPVTVRRAARRLGLASESSYRFERGVDPVGVETASARAGALIRELAGGEEAAVRDVGAKPSPRRAITVEGPRLNRWLGTRLEAPTIRSTLAQLSCRVASSGMSASMQVTPPSFRQDLTQAVDLYEEVARVMRMPVEKVKGILKIAQEPISLQTPIGEEGDTTFGDFIEDKSAVSPANATAYSMLKEQMDGVLSTLTEREEKVLRLRFGIGDGYPRTLEEVGQIFNVTRERVRQIEAKALRKLRHPTRARKLKNFLDLKLNE